MVPDAWAKLRPMRLPSPLRLAPLLPLAGLTPACQYLEETRTIPSQIAWDGVVLAVEEGATEGTPLSEGSLEIVDLEDSLVAEGTYDGSVAQGYWWATVPVDTEVALRVAGPPGGSDSLPELGTWVWRGRTPTGRATWLTGALFARERALVEATLEALDPLMEATPASIYDGEVALLWGEPWAPDELAGATMEVEDGAEEVHPVIAVTIGSDGVAADAAGGPVDFFLATDLAPGAIRLRVTTAAGAEVETTWPARGGDVLSAVFYALPEGG